MGFILLLSFINIDVHKDVDVNHAAPVGPCSTNSSAFQEVCNSCCSYLLSLWDMNNWSKFLAADQDGRDWAGIAEVRTTLRQVVIPCPTRWPQPGWTYSLPAAGTRGQGWWQNEVGRGKLRFYTLARFTLMYVCSNLTWSWLYTDYTGKWSWNA